VRVSVVIPARNEEAYLPSALEAVLAQTLPPFEVIVVDNASTDRTREVAEAFGARVVFCGRKGVAYARQAGLLAARGEGGHDRRRLPAHAPLAGEARP